MLKEQHIACTGYEVFAGELDKAFSSEKMIINTINQNSYCIAENDLEFKEVLNKSDILLSDGIGIVAAAKLLEGKKIKKIAKQGLSNPNHL